MEVHFNPDLQPSSISWQSRADAQQTQGSRDVVAGYSDELAQTREMLNSRYDDLKSGKVKPIPGEEVVSRLREKSAARRSQRGSSREK